MDEKCKIYQDLLVEHALGETGQKERAFLKSHLASCAQCRRELAVLSDTVGVLRRERRVDAPAGLAERTLHRIGAMGEQLAHATRSFEGTDIFRPSTWRVRKSLVGWMVAASVLVMAMAGLVTEVGPSTDMRRMKICQTNMRMIATALRQYAIDHDGFYPTGPDWYKALDWQYLRSHGAFKCPSRLAIGAPSEAEVDYIYSPDRVNVKSDADYPLMWDRTAAHDQLGRSVLFANGHIVWIEEDKFLLLLARYKIEESQAYYR